MPLKRSQAPSHSPNSYTQGNIRYSKSIHATAHPYRGSRLGPRTVGWDTLLCASARLHDRRALQAAHHRTQLSAEATTAHKIGAKLQAQATHGRSEAIAHERHYIVHVRVNIHMSLHDDIDGVGVELGGRWPIKKLGLKLEERGPQSCTCHLGGGRH